MMHRYFVEHSHKRDTRAASLRERVSHNTSKSMRKLLRTVVSEGSGKRASVLGYEVADKTGMVNQIIRRKMKAANKKKQILSTHRV